MSGAAILCCRGALCAGAGLVTLAVPESLLPIVEASLRSGPACRGATG